jgi:hypothetical protein
MLLQYDLCLAVESYRCILRICLLNDLPSIEDTSTSLLLCSLSLHFLRHFNVDLEELRYAAVEADGFALVKVGLAVLIGDALLCARVDQSERQDDISLLLHSISLE